MMGGGNMEDMKGCTRRIKGITVSEVCYNLSVPAMKNWSGHSSQKKQTFYAIACKKCGGKFMHLLVFF